MRAVYDTLHTVHSIHYILEAIKIAKQSCMANKPTKENKWSHKKISYSKRWQRKENRGKSIKNRWDI